MLDQQLKLITPSLLESSQSYSEYREMIDKLLSQNKTTGPIQTEGYLEYTRMNVKRMNRWDKTAKISSEMEEMIKSISIPIVFLVITEAWCGDAAQSIPYISKLADLNPNIQLKLVLRDENPDLMDAYLTEGARSIPKLIVLSDKLEDLGTWGPRPKYLQDRLKAYKLDPMGISSKEFSEGTHLWYAKDKNRSLESELMDLFKSIFDL
ncbi:MAG: thioredoxin family protein [Algoriphagus sp.]|uniref:thioredoxin family protein n=1 Tax=Algoriphagus sp. TaxID=1872435 RepID=UPI00262CDB78|nr:thioredoxin family protein [Algoriphagus sp.]MDG1278295.1 thioredoxin family protein [Algoriphagus sp.]